jgi:hypothetical protein
MLQTGQSLRAHTSAASSGTRVVPTCLEPVAPEPELELETEPMDIQEMAAEQERAAEPERASRT